MSKNLKRRIIKIILILLMIGFIGYMLWNSSKLDCNKCTIVLKSSKNMPLNYTMNEFYEITNKEGCPIIWDRVWGYVKRE